MYRKASHSLINMVLILPALAAVSPAPKEVVPDTISGVKPRNVVYILSDDHRFDAMSFLGHQFAETPVMDSIAANGAYLKNALVIYMGDNGFMFGEHGLIDKRVAYETSMRVPMLMQCPEIIKGGTVVEEMIANIDVAPTVMEAMSLKKPAHMDGESFLPLAQGKKIPWREQFLYVYYWEKNFPQTPTSFALRTPTAKYITYYGLWDSDEYYDLAAEHRADVSR